MDHTIGKTGDAQIKKVGHTEKAAFGIDPNAKARGVAAVEPREVNFK